MTLLQTEGIILHVIPYRDFDHIVTLFTPTAGILKLFFHGSRSKRRGGQSLCQPLNQVEVICRATQGELYRCQEMSLIHSFCQLRQNLDQLDVGCHLIRAVFDSQMVEKPAPQLYALLCFYLAKLPLVLQPKILKISFYLKLLLHEGLLAFPFHCAECEHALLTSAYINGAQAWCTAHRPTNSSIWREKDLDLIYKLACCQNYREIHAETIPSDLQREVTHFFETSFSKN